MDESLSSEPSTTTDSETNGEDQIYEDLLVHGNSEAFDNGDSNGEEEVHEVYRKEQKKKKFISPYILIVMIDILIPLMLILSSISCTSIMGMFFVILMYLHVIISNRINTSFVPTRTFLFIDLGFNFVVFCFSIVSYFVDLSENDALRIMGLDFKNIVSNSPTFTVVTSLIAIICQTISLSVLKMTSIKELRETRIKIFGTFSFQFTISTLWAICNAFNAASNFSYLYLPIMLYFIISNISMTLVGRIVLPVPVIYFIMGYSLFYGLFDLYMVSYIGEKYNPASQLKFMDLAPQSVRVLNVVITVLFAYFSVQQMSVPGFDIGKPRTIPIKLSILGRYLLHISLVLAFIFAVAYPNYLSILWIVVIFVSTFSKFERLKKRFYPTLSIVFVITFIAMILTSFEIFNPPNSSGTERSLDFLKLFGLFRYKNDFTFSCCGFYLIWLFGQVGQIVHSDFIVPKTINEKNKTKNKAVRAIKKIRHYIILYSTYFFLLIYSVTGIIIGYYPNRIAYNLFSVVIMIIVLLSIYFEWSFQISKILAFLIILVSGFYKVSINSNCIGIEEEKCLLYGKWKNIDDMIKTGLVPPINQSSLSFNWSLILMFFLSVYLSKYSEYNRRHLPPFVTTIIYLLIALLHFTYLFVYETNLFSILFLSVGVIMVTSQYFQKVGFMLFACLISCIAVIFQLCMMLLTHFDETRNFIASAIPASILDASKIYEPSVEVGLLAAILFLSTITFNSKGKGQFNLYVRAFLYEARKILNDFYFYLCWIFIFAFSIVNDNPSFIKFILMVFFAFGRWSSKIFYIIRKPFLVFNVLYLILQYIFHVFDLDSPDTKHYANYKYFGFYFSTPGKPTHKQRNSTIILQVIVMFIGIFNIRPMKTRKQPVQFEMLASTRIYNAICAFLHHLLPLIVKVSLCVSTIYNPSLFGWLSFVVMIFINFKPEMLKKHVDIITLLFNICFIIQYLLYLGFPNELFNKKSFNIMNYIHKSEETKERIKNWFKWAGFMEVRSLALITNCISAFFFTFYITFVDLDVNYTKRYNELPKALKHFVNFFTIHIYEIMIIVILIISSQQHTIDGFLFFVLTSALFFSSLLSNYSKSKVLNIMFHATFFIIGLRIFSRLPIFTEDDVGKWVKKAFDLPFQGSSDSELTYIFIYFFECLCIHIFNCDLYHELNEVHTKKLAYRFIRSRQLKYIEELDENILKNKAEMELSNINKITSVDEDLLMQRIISGELNFIANNENSQNNNVEEKENESIFKTIINHFVNFIIKILASSLPINSEAGINELTLQSIIDILEKNDYAFENKKEFIISSKEKQFLSKLPPSFKLNFHSIISLTSFELYNQKQKWYLFIKYITQLFKVIAIPFLMLMLLIYTYKRPYVFGFLITVFFYCIMLPLKRRNSLLFNRILFILTIIMFGFRALSKIDLLNEKLIDANNSDKISKMNLNVISVFGLSPNSSSACEILLFIAVIFYIMTQKSYCEVFSPRYYSKMFESMLSYFPQKYHYESKININTEKLELKVKSTPLSERFFADLNLPGLMITNHHILLLIVDIISIIILLFCWGRWSQKSASGNVLSEDYSFEIDASFIFILIIRVIFTVVFYYCNVLNNNILLFFTGLVSYAYTYCLLFFYIPSCEDKSIPSSLEFYYFVRFFAQIIIANKCLTCKNSPLFKFPNFKENWRSILLVNKLSRYIPYVFEIQNILEWMSEKTFVSLSDRFIIKDIENQLETLIAKQSDPKAENKANKHSHRFVISGILLLIFAVVIFVPLLIFTSGSSSTSPNRPLNAELEIGLSYLPPFFTSFGVVSEITSQQHQIIADYGNSLSSLVYVDQSSLSLIDFPLNSYQNWFPNDEQLSSIIKLLESDHSAVPYFKLSIYFEKPASISGVTNVHYQVQSNPLTKEEKSVIINTFQGLDTNSFNIQLPTTIFVPLTEDIFDTQSLRRDANLIISSGLNQYWKINLNSTSPLSVLNGGSFRVLIWSEPTNDDNLLGELSSSSSMFLLIYVIIIIVIGIFIRFYTLGNLDDLWINRMDNPQALYTIIISINVFRISGKHQGEYMLTKYVLDTLRSKEKCLHITANQTAASSEPSEH